jgi:hypothetical protein
MQTVTYARVIVDFRPQKVGPHRIRITARGNLITYPGELSTRTANLSTSKLMWNSVLSTKGAQYMCLDIFLSHGHPGPIQVHENANILISEMDYTTI